MEDHLRTSAMMTTFAKENINKVPADIFFRKENSDFLFFNAMFEHLEILGIHLIKKNEWLFGIYSGCDRVGYFYNQGNLTLEQQQKCVADYLPEDINNLQEKVKQYEGKINFHRSRNDAYKIIGELHHNKQVIQRIKTIPKRKA